MLRHLMNLTNDQKQIVAWSTLLDHILDDKARDLINRVGIEYVVKEIRGRYTFRTATIVPV